jgi:predicted enzyme related to lactoylglutathione lyase
MAADQPPSVFRAGGVSYLHIPCGEPSRAADFYEAVFKWTPRRDSDEPAFSDATGHVIGHFIAGEPAPEDTGILLFVYVEDVDAALRRVEQHGGSVTQPPRPEGGLHVATFRDPEGNRIGLWTETRHVRDPRHDHHPRL